MLRATIRRRFISSCAEIEQQEHTVSSHLRSTECENSGAQASLVQSYLDCGRVSDAWVLFSGLHATNVVTWTRLVAAFAQKGHLKQALQVYREMHLQGVHPDTVMFITLLNSCARHSAVEQGREVHTHILEAGLELSSRLGNSLVDLYAKCMHLEDACMAFHSLTTPDIISWNTLISAYTSCSGYKETLTVFQSMQLQGMKPDAFTLVTLLNACSEPVSISSIHERITELGLSSETVVCNALVNAYGKVGMLETAREIFEWFCMRKDLISWNVIISSCTLAGDSLEAFSLYRRMQLDGVRPNDVVFLNIMNACTGPEDLHYARLIHDNIGETMCYSQSQIGNALISMYGRCVSLEDIRRTFESMPYKDVVSWNSLIAAYAVNGYCDYALELYNRMQLEGLLPTNVTFATVLNACNERFLKQGRMIHANLVEAGYDTTDIVTSALVDMYCKSGSLKDAHDIFMRHSNKDSVVMWTTIIGGYSEAGKSEEALRLYSRMLFNGVKPNKVTLVTVLNACANMASASGADSIRSQVYESGCESDLAVKNALLNLLGKSGNLDDIEKLFKQMEHWDVIAGTVLVSVYSQHGLWRKSLEAYHRILQHGLRPTPTTYISVLTSCSSLATVPEGKPIHESIVETGCDTIPLVRSSLVNLYGKCGNLKLARELFEGIQDKTLVVSWTAIMAGYAQHGHMQEARKMLYKMQQAGVRPDRITFISVLSACSHAGLVEDACYFFTAMTKELEIQAGIEHYGCMIDLLGRSGWLNEAQGLVKKMNVKPDAVLWTSLLGSCKVHGNLKLAELAAHEMVDLAPETAATYVQLSNAYAVFKPGLGNTTREPV